MSERTFPVLGSSGERVPWSFVEKHAAQIVSNHAQSVERLAERGGLAWAELYHATRGEDPGLFKQASADTVYRNTVLKMIVDHIGELDREKGG